MEIFIVFCITLNVNIVISQTVNLKQGNVVGLKIFPETSKNAVLAFLGIPYAAPPVGDLRFALPEPYKNWNHTILGNYMKPICPQLQNGIYEETTDEIQRNIQTDEDCLYLNIWTPETNSHHGKLPVLVVITGEEMSFDWYLNRPSGLDLASEEIVIVHIQYRMNIFGWLGTNTPDFPGNFAIADQDMALKWIQDNIQKFGGNPKHITLLGHGTSGVTCALIHLIKPNNDQLFSKLILMSGSPFSFKINSDQSLSESIIAKLGCQGEKPYQILNCLRLKSVSDLEKSFEIAYHHGNYSKMLGPVIDKFSVTKFIPNNLEDVIRLGAFRKIPMIIGLCSNEGAFIRNYWIDLAREGFDSLKLYINYTILPLILEKYSLLKGDNSQVLKAIKWKYFQLSKPRNPSYLLQSLQRFISEAEYEAPFFNIIELIARTLDNNSHKSSNLYVYSFQISNSMDLRGKINLFGGASHTSDLPFLMGPSLFQQIARRRLNTPEEKLCRRLRQVFGDFIKTGTPTSKETYDIWEPYTASNKFIKVLGNFIPLINNFDENLREIEDMLQKKTVMLKKSNWKTSNPYELQSLGNVQHGKSSNYLNNKQDYEYYDQLRRVYSFWNILLPSIYNKHLQKSQNGNINNITGDKEGRETVILAEAFDCNKYKHAFFWMLALVFLLFASLAICVYVLRRDYPGWKDAIRSGFLQGNQCQKIPRPKFTPHVTPPLMKRQRQRPETTRLKNEKRSKRISTLDSISSEFGEEIEVKNWRYNLTHNYV